MDTLAAGGQPGTDWTGTGGFGVTIVDHHSGIRCASTGGTGDSTLTQTFTAPPNATQVAVWYKMWCQGSACPDNVFWDWAKVTLKDNVTQNTVTMLNNTYNLNGQWNLTPQGAVIPGRSYTITLVSHADSYTQDVLYTYWDDLEFTTNAGAAMMSSLLK